MAVCRGPMDSSCLGAGRQANPDPLILTNCNNPGKPCGAGDPAAFLAALHSRIVDRIAWPWARDWLARHARLGLAMKAGWPVLQLILEADPPPLTSPLLLQRHYREAAIAGKGSGPLADLAASLEVVEVAR